MRISLDTQYAIGDTVTIPDAHTTVDVKITDILVRVGYHGPAFAEITYLTDNPDVQSVMEQAILGKGVAPTTEPELQGYTEFTSNPAYASYEEPFDEQVVQWRKDEECDQCRIDRHND